MNVHTKRIAKKRIRDLVSSFGMLKDKWKKSAQEIKDQARKELYDE